MICCTVDSNVDPEVVRPLDRWNHRRSDYDSFRRDLFKLPRPVEGNAKDVWSSFQPNSLLYRRGIFLE